MPIFGKPLACCTTWITSTIQISNAAHQGHPFVGVAWLRDHGWSEEVCRAILSHADYANVSRETALEKTLYAVDELSSFVVAVALFAPKKHSDVDVRAVKKKMKDKAFARAVNREDISVAPKHWECRSMT